MLNHVVVGSNDIERSKHFYDAVLGVLGATRLLWGKPVSSIVTMGAPFASPSPSTAKQLPLPMGARSGSNAVPPSKLKRFTTWP